VWRSSYVARIALICVCVETFVRGSVRGHTGARGLRGLNVLVL
jgi:hypothetical protein